MDEMPDDKNMITIPSTGCPRCKSLTFKVVTKDGCVESTCGECGYYKKSYPNKEKKR